MKMVLALGLATLALTGCAAESPQPTKTVYVTEPAQAPNPQSSYGAAGSGAYTAPDWGPYDDCMMRANDIWLKSVALADQARTMSLRAGFGDSSDPAARAAASDLEAQANDLNLTSINMRSDCESLRPE